MEIKDKIAKALDSTVIFTILVKDPCYLFPQLNQTSLEFV